MKQKKGGQVHESTCLCKASWCGKQVYERGKQLSKNLAPAGPIRLKVWGPLACFSRPECKVERVSYEVMTPSAARNILRAIFRKPEFEWHIQEIHMLKPIAFTSVMRNEVNNKASVRSALHNYVEDHRTQRNAHILRDVAYLIVADAHVYASARQQGETPEKYRAQFLRYVRRGQCHSMPFLGCREYSAFFQEADGSEQPVPLTKPLGRMLFDFGDYQEDGQATPHFFEAHLKDGILAVPGDLYQQMNWRRPNHVSPVSS